MATSRATEGCRRGTATSRVARVLRFVVIVWIALSPLGNGALAHGLGGLGGLLGHGFRAHGILSGHGGPISHAYGAWARVGPALRARPGDGERIRAYGAPVLHAWSGGHRWGAYERHRLGFRPFHRPRAFPFEYGYPGYVYPAYGYPPDEDDAQPWGP